MRPRPHYRHRRPKQCSPFLTLPREIRDVIYQHALVREQSIDLCPNDFLTPECPDPPQSDQLNQAQHESQSKRVRLQKDLLYVRTQMAPCLLETCNQVYAEAAGYFWGSNTFRFSHDKDWFILLRFLLTIGPAARARLRRVDVFAPIYQEHLLGDQWVSCDSVISKNQPKLHMLKLKWGGSGIDWSERFELEWCMTHVCDLLVQDGEQLRNMNLNLLVPPDHAIAKLESFKDQAVWHRLWGDWDDWEMYPCALLQDLEFIKIAFVVEPRAVLWNAARIMGEITRQGWDLVCLPDSGWVSDPEENGWSRGRSASTTHIYKAPPRPSEDYPLRLDRLFVDTDWRQSVHAEGGKAASARTKKKVSRVLKGFGGPCVVKVTRTSCYRCRKDWPEGEQQHYCCILTYRCAENLRPRNVRVARREAEIRYQGVLEFEAWVREQQLLPNNVFVDLCEYCYVRALNKATQSVLSDSVQHELYQNIRDAMLETDSCVCKSGEMYLVKSMSRLLRPKIAWCGLEGFSIGLIHASYSEGDLAPPTNGFMASFSRVVSQVSSLRISRGECYSTS